MNFTIAYQRLIAADPRLDSWSSLGPMNVLKERKAKAALKPTSLLSRAETRSDPTIRWAFVDPTNKIRTLTLLSSKDATKANFVTLSGDDHLPEATNKPGDTNENNSLVD
jgi:hypothetical protein